MSKATKVLKGMELCVAVIAAVAAVGFYFAAAGPNAAEYGVAFQIGCLVGMVGFEWYAVETAAESLFGRDGLVFDFPAHLARRSKAAR